MLRCCEGSGAPGAYIAHTPIPVHCLTVGPRSAHRLPSHNSKTVLLSGANPRIAKGDGDGHVQSPIAAMPGWKSDIGRGLTGNDIPRLKNGL